MTKKVKIVIRLVGGLGNQMFCYAMARAISIKYDCSIVLDIKSGFEHDIVYKRKFVLDRFNVSDSYASNWESYSGVVGKIRRRVSRTISKLFPSNRKSYYKELSARQYDRGFLNYMPLQSVYFEGYWHSYLYFQNIRDVLLQEFTLKRKLTKATKKDRDNILTSYNPVCIGIRLYQEVKDNDVHKVQNLKYYQDAIDLINQKVENAHFFVFCNDETWVLNEFQMNVPITVISPKRDFGGECEDLYLQSLCKHYIISNSSYYWWGAWLSENENKIVIAPKYGFYNKDIYPKEWILI